MDVSIIIVNYNTYSLTSKCITSVIKYTKNIDYEIILVDNASTEINPDQFALDFPNLKLVKSTVNLGFAKGNNLGLTYAQADTFILLNSDIELTDNSIFFAWEKINENLNVGALSAKLLFPDGKVQSVANAFPSIGNNLIEMFRLQKLFPKWFGSKKINSLAFNYEEVQFVDWIWGAFFVFRRDVLNKFKDGILAEDFFMYGEDLLWCYQIHSLNYKILYYPKSKAIHYLSASSSGFDGLKRFKTLIEHEFIILSKYRSKPYIFVFYFTRMLLFYSLGNRYCVKLGNLYKGLIVRKMFMFH